jgi:hypothetical protein
MPSRPLPLCAVVDMNTSCGLLCRREKRKGGLRG